MDKWTNKRQWVAILIILSLLSSYTLWYLSLNPQHIPVFLATTIIALGFVAVMALLPKYRQRLVKKVLEHHVEQRKMGRELYGYYRVALLVIILCALVFPVVLQYQLIASQYMPLFVLVFCIVNLAAGVIFIAGFFKAKGKLGPLLIAVILALFLLGILIGWMAKHG